MLIQILELPETHPNYYDFDQSNPNIWYVLRKQLEPDEEPEFQEHRGSEIPVPLLEAKMPADTQSLSCKIVAFCIAMGAKLTLGLENEPIDAIRIFIKGPLSSPRIGAAFRRKRHDDKTTTDTASSKKS